MSLKATIEAAQHYLKPEHVDCVVYHSPCNDGSGAAVSAWVALGETVAYEKLAYHKDFNVSAILGKNVIVIDASFKKEELRRLRTLANKIMVLDHHDSAMKDLAGEPGCFFEMKNSGAMLSWHYFNGLGAPAPKLITLIEDRDLWNWKYRDESEPLYYALRERSANSDFRTFIQYLEPEKLAEIIAFGKTLVTSNHLWCEQTAQQAQRHIFKLPGTDFTYNIMCLEVANDKLVSELAEHLYTKHMMDFVMLWCKISGGKYKISFRSNNHAVNLGDIATVLGGGGHKQAAGAVVDISPWELLDL
jgi:Exopolyphosphatase-related proteins